MNNPIFCLLFTVRRRRSFPLFWIGRRKGWNTELLVGEEEKGRESWPLLPMDTRNKSKSMSKDAALIRDHSLTSSPGFWFFKKEEEEWKVWESEKLVTKSIEKWREEEVKGIEDFQKYRFSILWTWFTNELKRREIPKGSVKLSFFNSCVHIHWLSPSLSLALIYTWVTTPTGPTSSGQRLQKIRRKMFIGQEVFWIFNSFSSNFVYDFSRFVFTPASALCYLFHTCYQ